MKGLAAFRCILGRHEHQPAGELSPFRDRLLASPAVAVLGARQVGKTTIARELTGAWPGPSEHFDLERPRDRQALTLAPERVLGGCRGLVVLDEVQRLPRIFEILRPLCDDPDRKAVFALLGSVSPGLVKGVSETLAGRIRFVRMGGFSLPEVGSRGGERLWLRGGFPRAFLADSPADWADWMDGTSRCSTSGSCTRGPASIRCTTVNPRPARRLTSHRAGHSRSAAVLRYVLYLDGPSDLVLLRALAERLGHAAAHVWDDRANAFYLRDLRRDPGTAPAADEVPGSGAGSGRIRFALTPARHFRALRRDDPDLGGLAILDAGTALDAPRSGLRAPLAILDAGTAPIDEIEEDGLTTVRWRRWEVERHLLRSEVLGILSAGGHFNRPVIDRIEDELQDATRSVRPDGGGFPVDRERVKRTPSEFVREFFRRLADRIGDDGLLPRGDLHRLVRSMDRKDIPSEVHRVLDVLERLFRNARRDQKCPVTAGPATIAREGDRHVFVVEADWADGPYRITGQALALIGDLGPDDGARNRVVESLRREWDAGVERPLVDEALVESCSA